MNIVKEETRLSSLQAYLNKGSEMTVEFRKTGIQTLGALEHFNHLGRAALQAVAQAAKVQQPTLQEAKQQQ